MHFGLAIVATILLSIGSIFLVYKLFTKPAAVNNFLKPPTSQTFNTPKPSPESKDTSLNPSSKPTTSPSIKPKAVKSSTAPSLVLLSNNTASPSPLSSSVISGTIDFIGTAPSSSSLVITARPTGSGEQFKVVVDGITPQDNASWTWALAQSGVKYDMFAVLKGKSSGVDIDYASSPASTVTSPYQGQVFVVNAGYTLAAPTGTITVTCTTHNSNNTWATTITLPAVSGALMYHLQVGSTSGASDVVDATTGSLSISANLQDSVTYYAKYSAASVSYPTSYQYSSYSAVSSIRCP